MTDSRILKIVAQVPIYTTTTLGFTKHRTSCGVFKTPSTSCSCPKARTLLVTLDEVRIALEKFQQELVFNMPDPHKAADEHAAVQATNKHLIGDSQLEIRYG